MENLGLKHTFSRLKNSKFYGGIFEDENHRHKYGRFIKKLKRTKSRKARKRIVNNLT